MVVTGLETDGDCRWPAGLLGGGGTGAAVDSRMLDERDLTDSIEDREGVAGSSGGSSACVLLSVLECAPLRGGGAGFLSVDVGFWTGVEEECDVFGGVGGRGGGTTSASGSISTSGTLPAASLSNMLSLGSCSDRAGGAGSGLLTSVGLREALRPDDVSANPPEVRRSNTCGRSCPTGPTLIDFPCLVAGGGGGNFFREPDCLGGGELISPRFSSSPSGSGSEISCDVRGDSSEWLLFSKMDCRDTDEASVMLPPSPAMPVGCRVAEPEVPAAPGAGPCPVSSSFLKASTSRPFPAGEACSAEVDPPSFAACSMSSKVLWKGLGGGPRPVYG